MPSYLSNAYQTLSGSYRDFRRVSRRSELMWRYTLNLPHVMAYRLARPELHGEVARVVDSLDQNGIAISSVEALMESDSLYRQIVREVDGLEQARAADLARARQGGNVGAFKTFNVELLDNKPHPGTVFYDFAQQRQIKSVADGYFGMKTTLRACNVWHTLVTGEQARQSQLWHRDPEDRYILKLFVLLSDVDDGCGPFNYAAGSHMKGESRRGGPIVETHGLQDEEMARIIPREQWVKCTGKKGTVIFADTRGYHKGGLARERERLMFVSMYLSY